MNSRRNFFPAVHSDVAGDQDIDADGETGDQTEDDADGFRVETDGSQCFRRGKLSDDRGIR